MLMNVLNPEVVQIMKTVLIQLALSSVCSLANWVINEKMMKQNVKVRNNNITLRIINRF